MLWTFGHFSVQVRFPLASCFRREDGRWLDGGNFHGFSEFSSVFAGNFWDWVSQFRGLKYFLCGFRIQCTVGHLGLGILTQFCKKVNLMSPSPDFRGFWPAEWTPANEIWSLGPKIPRLFRLIKLRLSWSVYWAAKNLQLLQSTRRIESDLLSLKMSQKPKVSFNFQQKLRNSFKLTFLTFLAFSATHFPFPRTKSQSAWKQPNWPDPIKVHQNRSSPSKLVEFYCVPSWLESALNLLSFHLPFSSRLPGISRLSQTNLNAESRSHETRQIFNQEIFHDFFFADISVISAWF